MASPRSVSVLDSFTHAELIILNLTSNVLNVSDSVSITETLVSLFIPTNFINVLDATTSTEVVTSFSPLTSNPIFSNSVHFSESVSLSVLTVNVPADLPNVQDFITDTENTSLVITPYYNSTSDICHIGENTTNIIVVSGFAIGETTMSTEIITMVVNQADPRLINVSDVVHNSETIIIRPFSPLAPTEAYFRRYLNDI